MLVRPLFISSFSASNYFPHKQAFFTWMGYAQQAPGKIPVFQHHAKNFTFRVAHHCHTGKKAQETYSPIDLQRLFALDQFLSRPLWPLKSVMPISPSVLRFILFPYQIC